MSMNTSPMGTPRMPASMRNPHQYASIRVDPQIAAQEKFTAANEAISAGRYEEATDLLDDAISLNRKSSKYFAARSFVSLMQNNTQKAIADADVAMTLDKKNPEGYVRKALALSRTGNPGEAYRVAKDGIAVDGNNAELHSAAMHAARQLGKTDDSMIHARQTLLLSDNPVLVAPASEVLFQQKAKDEDGLNPMLKRVFSADMVKGTTSNPFEKLPLGYDCVDTDEHLGNLCAEGQQALSAGNADAAVHYYENALVVARVLNRDQQVQHIRQKLGAAYRARGDTDKSLEMFAGLNSASPRAGGGQDVNYYSSLGNSYFTQGNHSKAIEAHQKHLEMEESLGNTKGIGTAHNNVACIHFALHRYAEARSSFQASLRCWEQLDDTVNEAIALTNLAACCIFLKQYKDALPFLKDALRMHPDLFKELIQDSPGDLGKRTTYLYVVKQTYRLIVEVYFRTGHHAVALEWAERAKAVSCLDAFTNKCNSAGDIDIGFNALLRNAIETKQTFVSYFFLSKTTLLVWVLRHEEGQLQCMELAWPQNLVWDPVEYFELCMKEKASRSTSGSAMDDAFGTLMTETTPSSSTLHRLHMTLIRPIQHLLPPSHADEAQEAPFLIISPHQSLLHVPWPALHDAEESVFLIDEYAIATTYSASQWVHNAVIRAQLPLTVRHGTLIYDNSVPSIASGKYITTIKNSSIALNEFCGSLEGCSSRISHTTDDVSFVHFACRSTRFAVMNENQCTIVEQGDNRKQALPGVGVQSALRFAKSAVSSATSSIHSGACGWLYFAATTSEFKEASNRRAFDPYTQVGLVNATHALPIPAVASKFKFNKIATVVLDLVGWVEDVVDAKEPNSAVRHAMAAGASTVVHSCWPMSDDNGARGQLFSVFYKHMVKEAEWPAPKNSGTANSAAARRAMIQTRATKDHFMDWAVLNVVL